MNRDLRRGLRRGLRLAGLIAFSAGALPETGRCQDPEGVTWMTDLQAAEALAARSGKPLLLVFR